MGGQIYSAYVGMPISRTRCVQVMVIELSSFPTKVNGNPQFRSIRLP